jgi:hypothetical protein
MEGKGRKIYLSFKFYLLLVVVRRVPFRKSGFPSAFVSTFPSTCKLGELGGDATHCRFWIRMKERTILKVAAHALERTGLDWRWYCSEVVERL